MAEGRVTKEELLKVAAFLGNGFYRATHDGQFVECDSKAREIFGIPQEETDLSKYSIKDLYVVPAERELRLHKLKEKRGEPLSGTLSMRIEKGSGKKIPIFWSAVVTGKINQLTKSKISSNIL